MRWWYGLAEPNASWPARPRVRERSSVLAAAVAAVFPIATVAVTASRLFAARWVPLTDDAVITLRAQDVFSRHIPLVGMPSTLALYAHGHAASHPGPLEFFALAVPYAVFGRSPGALLAGVAALNIAAILAIAWAAWRLGGAFATTVAMLFVGALIWGVGNGTTAEVWNPAVALLPFAAFLALSLCLARGDIVAFPAMVVAGSFAAQAHLGYLAPVGVVGVWAIATFAVHARRQWRASGDDTATAMWRRRVARVSVLSAAAFALCWWAPIAQQLGGDNPNMTAIVDGARAGGLPTAGVGFGVRTVGRIVGLPPPFGMRPMTSGAAIVQDPTAADVVRFFVPWSLIAVGALLAWRRRNRLATAGVITAALALVVGTITTMRAPVLRGTELVFVYNVRFLWPIAMFFWFTVVFVVWQLLGPSRTVVRNGASVFAVGSVVALAVVLGVRSSAPQPDPTMKVTRDLSAALAAHVHAPGPYVVRAQGGGGAGFVPVSVATATGINVALERHRVHTYAYPGLQVSETIWGHRIYKGQRVRGTVWIVSGGGPAPTPTARSVGTSVGATARDRAAEQRLLRELRAALVRDGGARATARGRSVLGGGAAAGSGDHRDELAAVVRDAAAALADGSLATVVDAGLVDAPGGHRAMLDRYEELRQLSSPAWTVTAYVDGPPG